MEYKSFMEALKGKQHKIDKNKNGQIDAHDFKLLRKEESEQIDELSRNTLLSYANKVSLDSQKHSKDPTRRSAEKANRSVAGYAKANNRLEKPVKEEVQIDEIRRMKTKLNTLDDISNKSVARQKLSNLMKSGKARGALIANKMRTLNMGDDIDQEDLDALYEVLSKDAKAGDYISDFVHSTNPKFDGKTKKERIKMALGAYYDTNKKKDGISEGRYQSYSGPSHGHAYGGSGFGRREREDDEYHVPDRTPVAPTLARKYIKGTPENKAAKTASKPINGHPTNEEVESVAEGVSFPYDVDHMPGKRGIGLDSAKPRDTYVKTFHASKEKEAQEFAKKNGYIVKKHVYPKSANNSQPHEFQVHKLEIRKEEFELDEVSQQTLHSYRKKASAQKRAADDVVSGDADDETWKKNVSLSAKRRQGINAANKRLGVAEAKDPAEYDQEGDMAKTQLRSIKYHADELHEMLSDNDNLPEWVQSKLTLAQDYLQTVCDYMYSKDKVNEESKAVTVKVNHAGDAPHEEKWEPVKKIKKPVKESFDDEGNLISNKVSYKEFMLEYTPGAGGVTQIKGRSYGANYSDPEGADDADDNKPMKPATEKRGRGRPAGAKSGARKITGTSKLMNK